MLISFPDPGFIFKLKDLTPRIQLRDCTPFIQDIVYLLAPVAGLLLALGHNIERSIDLRCWIFVRKTP